MIVFLQIESTLVFLSFRRTYILVDNYKYIMTYLALC
jgi:hypothetical protein